VLNLREKSTSLTRPGFNHGSILVCCISFLALRVSVAIPRTLLISGHGSSYKLLIRVSSWPRRFSFGAFTSHLAFRLKAHLTNSVKQSFLGSWYLFSRGIFRLLWNPKYFIVVKRACLWTLSRPCWIRPNRRVLCIPMRSILTQFFPLTISLSSFPSIHPSWFADSVKCMSIVRVFSELSHSKRLPSELRCHFIKLH
jgi:hypothetical protein